MILPSSRSTTRVVPTTNRFVAIAVTRLSSTDQSDDDNNNHGDETKSSGNYTKSETANHDNDEESPTKEDDSIVLHDAATLAQAESQPSVNASSLSPPSSSHLSRDYSRGKIMLGGTALVLLLLPSRVDATVLVASKVGGACGFALAAGVCHLLRDAHDHNRLTSDTYKRLNLGLLGFATLGLFAFPGEAAFLPQAIPAFGLGFLVMALRVWIMKVAWEGWTMGFLREDASSPKIRSAIFSELRNGLGSTLAGLRVQNRKKGLSYFNLLLLVSMATLSSFMDGLFTLRVRRKWFDNESSEFASFSNVRFLSKMSRRVYPR